MIQVNQESSQNGCPPPSEPKGMYHLHLAAKTKTYGGRGASVNVVAGRLTFVLDIDETANTCIFFAFILIILSRIS